MSILAPRPPTEQEGHTPVDENDRIVPHEWAEGIALLDRVYRLKGYSDRQWQQLLRNGHSFLEVWGAVAASLGWGTLDVFGVHPRAPTARYDVMGLVPMIGDGEVVLVTAMHATIRKPSGSCLTYLRRPQPGAIPLWEVRL